MIMPKTTITTEQKNTLRKHANRHVVYLLDQLGVSFRNRGNVLQACCPCIHHGGDRNNYSSFSWRIDIGRWVCFSHHCEDWRGSDIFGLVAGIKNLSFVESVEWVRDILAKNSVNLNEHIPDPEVQYREGHVYIHEPLKEDNLKFLHPDPQYLLDRGFDLEVLRKYQAGLWTRRYTFMQDRVVFPVRDHEGYLVGYTGRTVHSEKYFSDLGLTYAKWVHGRHFNQRPKAGEFFTGSILFNLFRAKNYLEPCRRLILVEGPLDGMKLEEAGIHNWVATLGTKFCPSHRTLLVQYGILDLFVAYDNDLPKGPDGERAGEKGWERVNKVVGNLFNLHRVELPPEKDCGDLEVAQLQEIFKDIRC
jgi:hypothetical protein